MSDVGSSQREQPARLQPLAGAPEATRAPGQDVQVGLRAGDPPGPWWIVIQRQLGPLYVDRIGLGTVEAGGRVTEISLLFNGQLSMFGMTAAVDRLSITWRGGDVLAISSWSVDLMGLAISADLGGLMLAGGLLKIGRRDEHGLRRDAHGPVRGLRPVGLRRLHARTGPTRASSSSGRSTGRSAGRRRSSSPASAAGWASTADWSSPRTSPSSGPSRSSRPSTPGRRPPERTDGRAAPARRASSRTRWATSGSPRASRSPASRSSTGWPSSRSPSATAWRSTCWAWPGWRCPRPGCGAGVDRAGPARALLHARGRLHDQGPAHRQLVAAHGEHPAHGRLRLRDLVEGAAGGAVRPHHGGLPPELPPRGLPRRAAAGDHVADQRTTWSSRAGPTSP
jgi:hypothetical protein